MDNSTSGQPDTCILMLIDFPQSTVFSNQTEFFAYLNEDDPNGSYDNDGIYEYKNQTGMYCSTHFT